jgi:hypothetical protein
VYPSGNIGIGTLLPSAKLQVNSSSVTGSLLIQNTTGSTHLFVNGSTGFVGVGTAAPVQALDVSGNIATSGTTRISSSGVGTFASGTTVNALSICLSDGTNCPGGLNASSAGGWQNTSTTITSLANMTVNINGGSLFANGTLGNTPISGAGTRMMWIPGKAAFRAGVVTGAHWDAGNISENSTAFGVDTIANGSVGAAAFGISTVASGSYGAIAMGASSVASGLFAPVAIGYGSTASGNFGATAIGNGAVASGTSTIAIGNSVTSSGGAFGGSVALGYYTTAAGSYSTAIGANAYTNSSQSMAFGRYANASAQNAMAVGQLVTSLGTSSITLGSGNSTDALINNLESAMMLGMNSTVPTVTLTPSLASRSPGKVGIGTTAPGAMLTVNSSDVAGSLLIHNTTGSAHLFVNGSSGAIGIGNATLSITSAITINGNTTYTAPTSNAEVCFEKFIGTTQNYTRCIDASGSVTERIGQFAVN